jgi:hypothetical protein
MKNPRFTKCTIITILLIFAVVIRVLFASYQPKPIIDPADSVGYYSLGVQMIEHPTLKNLISEFRTPLYPVFLASIAKLSGFNGEDIFSSGFERAGNTIMGIQQVLGVVGIILFIFFLVQMGFSNRNIFVFSILTALNIFVFYWERSLLTEGLATTTLLISLALFAYTLKTPNTKNFILLWLSYAVNFLLRPAFVILPLVTLPFLFLALKKRTEKIKVIVIILFSCLVPALYIAGNSVYHNYRGIQHVGDIDMLGRILEFNTPINAGKTYKYFYEIVTDYRSHKGDLHPFRFINTYGISMYTNTVRMNELQSFTRSVVLHNLPSYATNAISTIPQAMTVVNSSIIKISDESIFPLGLFFSGLVKFYRALLPFNFLVFPLYPAAIYLFFRKKSTKRTLLVTIGSIAVSQIFFTVFIVYKDDYGRLFGSIQPLLLVFIIGTLQELFQPIRSSAIFIKKE